MLRSCVFTWQSNTPDLAEGRVWHQSVSNYLHQTLRRAAQTLSAGPHSRHLPGSLQDAMRWISLKVSKHHPENSLVLFKNW